MFKTSLILSCFFLTTLLASCPSSYPYSPGKGLANGWEFFCEDWVLPANGSGIIDFQAKGYDFYVAIFDEPNTTNSKYFLAIAGWGNTKSAIWKNGDMANTYITQNFTVDTEVYTNYSLGFSAEKSTVALYRNGRLVFALGEEDGYAAGNSRYISFAQYSLSNVYVQNVRTRPVCEKETTSFGQVREELSLDEEKPALLIKNKLKK